LLASLFPDVASLCGPVFNEPTLAKTLFNLLNSVLSCPPLEDNVDSRLGMHLDRRDPIKPVKDVDPAARSLV